MSAPTARWAHQAVFVPSQAAMYVIGGEVDHYGSQIVNDVFVLPLNSTNPSFIRGPNSALPPHSYASTTLSKDGNSLVVIGGLTSSCATDSLAHSLDLTNSSATWVHASPTKAVRRRGAAAEFVDDGTTTGKVMVVGGVADKYVCSSGSYTYPAADVLSLPLGSGSLVSTRSLPTSLTGSQLSVSDFGLARNKDGSAIYLVGGQDASGTLVPLNTVGKWTVENGWESQSTTGDVPPGRVGASLVAHPNLDLLVLHGGSTTVAAATGTDVTASSLLAFLNTTTWEWSTPHNLQPPASSAAAFHSSVMTDSGVMIAAFGLGPNGSPRSDMYYLDMRDPTASTWTWKSYWKPEMLSAYTPPVDTNTGAIATNNNLKDSSDEKKKITSITVPVIIATLILLPLAIWFIRRKLRINKKRRMARHFSFSESEDNGDFNRSLAQRSAGSPDNNNRMTFTQYGFGRDANEKEGNVLTDLIGHIKRLSKRRSSTDSDDDFIGGPMQTEREMVQVGPRTTTRLNEKTMKWEEIDFGLGRLDERAQGASARNSASLSREDLARPGVASTMVDPFADGSAVEGDLIDVGSVDSCATPLNDGHPALTVNIHPPTAPSTLRLSQHTFGSVNTSPDSSPEQKRFSSASASRDPFKSQEDGLDWSVLAQEMLDKPAFRSISPTSTLRSHSHPNAMPQVSTAVAPASMDRAGSPLPYETDMQSSDNVAVTPPRLPSFEFQRPSTQPTVALVNAKIGRRISDVQSLPFAGRRLPQPPKNRAVSQPHTDSGPRQLIGSVTPVTQLPRRGSLPQPPSTTPAPEGRRLSNPSIVISPDSPVLGTIKRESQLSKLRVVNMTEDDESSVTSSPTV